jgi:putative lipoprotein
MRVRASAWFVMGPIVALSWVGPRHRVHAADPDPWLGRDKALHFSATTALALGGYGASSFKTDAPLTRLAAGVTLGLGAGIAKELVDLGGAGDASWKDLTWDVIGTATGVLVASAIDWVIHRTRAPAARTPTSD